MSLYKQLWLAILLLLTVVFGVSFLVTTLSAKAYLEQQLAIKNADNAAALALSLTQQQADEVLMELTLAAQFDTGHYELIELKDPRGRTSIRRVDTQSAGGAPEWFMRLFPIAVEPGVASIQSGWKQAGTLTLRSHSRFAYEELWYNTLKLAGVFLLAALAAGFGGNALLKRILRPLGDVVRQAEAIRERRFVSIEEPGTLEFKRLVGAMNALSAHVKATLGQEAKRLQEWQREAHTDKVTGLRSRDPFLRELESMLVSDDVNASGSLAFVRLSALSELNQARGREATDRLLRDIGRALNRIALQHSGWSAGRLNGSDFAVLAPRELETEAFGREVQGAVTVTLADHEVGEECLLPASATRYAPGETPTQLMTRLDGALFAAQGEDSATLVLAQPGDIPARPIQQQMEEWREILESALQEQRISLASFPALDFSGELIHHEAPARLRLGDRTLTAGEFLLWINRLELSLALDMQVVQLALDAIARNGEPVGVNLTVAALVEPAFLSWLEESLSRHSEEAPLLWMELPETMAFRHLDNFKRLCNRAKSHGAHMGIEHMGRQLAELGQLHDVGLDYLKVDTSFVRDVHDNAGNQTLLRILCTLGHSIGVRVIAEGVVSEDERKALADVGMDGVTGPGIRL